MSLWELEFQTPSSASYRFNRFIESDDYRKVVVEQCKQGGEPSCFLDIIALWVVRSDALLYFPTHATFVFAILELIDEWVANDDKRMFTPGVYLWPFIQSADEAATDGLAIKTLSGSGVNDGQYYCDGVMNHPVMREDNFLVHRAELQNRPVQ